MMAWVRSNGDLDLLEWLEKFLALSGNSKGYFLDPFGGAVINMMESALTDLFWMGQGAVLSEEEQRTLPKRDTNYTGFVRHAGVRFQLYVMPVWSPIPFYGLMMQDVHVSDFALMETLLQIIRCDLPFGLVQLNRQRPLCMKSPSLITEALVVALNRMQILIDLSQEFFNDECNKNTGSELMVSARDRTFNIKKYRNLVRQFE